MLHNNEQFALAAVIGILAVAAISAPCQAGQPTFAAEGVARAAGVSHFAAVRVNISGHWGNVVVNVGQPWRRHHGRCRYRPIIIYPRLIVTRGYTYFHGFLSPYGLWRPYFGRYLSGRYLAYPQLSRRRLVRRPARELSASSRRDLKVPSPIPAPRETAKQRKLRRLTTSVPAAIITHPVAATSQVDAVATESDIPRYRRTRFSDPINYFGEGRTIDDLYD